MADEMAAMMVFGEIGNPIKKTVRDLRIANKEDPQHVREIYISISPSSMALAYCGDIMSAMGLTVPLCLQLEAPEKFYILSGIFNTPSISSLYDSTK
jgi:hypothetical protein